MSAIHSHVPTPLNVNALRSPQRITYYKSPQLPPSPSRELASTRILYSSSLSMQAVNYHKSVWRSTCTLRAQAYASSVQTSFRDRVKSAGTKIVLSGALTAALTVFPHDAVAVSGGGGLGTSLAGKDFSSQDLRNQKFYKADMRASNFSKANLQGANLFGAFAKDANFAGADLSNADVESVDFEGADLTDAVLVGAQATNARFKGTQFNNTDWTDAILRRDVQKQLCATAKGTNPVTGVDTRESLLCS